MAKLRELENFKEDYHNPEHYNSDSKEKIL